MKTLEALIQRCETALRWAASQGRVYLNDELRIRIRRPRALLPCCPVVLACAPDGQSALNAWNAARHMGWDKQDDVDAIVSSADDTRYGGFDPDPAIRVRLLRAAGLPENA